MTKGTTVTRTFREFPMRAVIAAAALLVVAAVLQGAASGSTTLAGSEDGVGSGGSGITAL